MRREQEFAKVSDHVLSDAADFNPVRAGRNGFLQCLRRIKLAAQLIEIGNLQIRPQFHGTGVRLHLPQNNFNQRALTDAVRTEQAQLVTAHHAKR